MFQIRNYLLTTEYMSEQIIIHSQLSRGENDYSLTPEYMSEQMIIHSPEHMSEQMFIHSQRNT